MLIFQMFIKSNNVLYLVTTLSYLVAVVLNLIGGF